MRFSSTGNPACANAAICLDPKSLAHITTSFFSVAQAPPAGGHENDACAPLLRRNPPILAPASHRTRRTPEDRLEPVPLKNSTHMLFTNSGIASQMSILSLFARNETMCRTYGAPHFTHHQSQGFRPGLAYAAPTALSEPTAQPCAFCFAVTYAPRPIFGFCTARHKSLLDHLPQIAIT